MTAQIPSESPKISAEQANPSPTPLATTPNSSPITPPPIPNTSDYCQNLEKLLN